MLVVGLLFSFQLVLEFLNGAAEDLGDIRRDWEVPLVPRWGFRAVRGAGDGDLELRSSRTEIGRVFGPLAANDQSPIAVHYFDVKNWPDVGQLIDLICVGHIDECPRQEALGGG